jgi:transposase
MDSDRRSAQVERLEVVDTGRRRRWSEDEKLKIVMESLRAPRQVAATARRYGVSRSLLLRWRRSFHPEPQDAPGQVGFVPARVVPDCGVAPGPVGPASSGGAIEIEFAAGVRMRITGAVDAATLKAVVAALADGRPR